MKGVIVANLSTHVLITSELLPGNSVFIGSHYSYNYTSEYHVPVILRLEALA